MADGATTPKIHAALQQRSVFPATHMVDTSFLDAALLVDSQAHYSVELLGPTRLDYHWQARQGAGFDALPSRLIGTSSTRSVRPVRSAQAGRRPWIIAGMPSSR